MTPAEIDALIAEELAALKGLERSIRVVAAKVDEAQQASTQMDRDVVAIHDLHAFLSLVWPEVEGGKPFIDAPYIHLICEEIQQAVDEIGRRQEQRARLVKQAAGDPEELTRLIQKHMGGYQQVKLVLAVPPRHGKSLIAKIIALGWMLLRWPHWKLIAVGAAALTEEHGPKLRRLIQSDTYQRLNRLAARMQDREPWEFASDQNTKTFFDTTARGRFQAQSIDAGITGKGCDVMVIDDPIDAKKALKAAPETAARWMEDIKRNWTQALADRFDEPAMSLVIVIMQRLHPDDLAGYFLKHEAGTRAICFPTEYDPDHPYLHPKDPRTKPGELLNPVRRGPEWVAAQKAKDPHEFACKHQGLPTLRAGSMVRRDWFPEAQRWPDDPVVMADRLIAEGGRLTIDVDAAEKGSAKNDWYVLLAVVTTPDGRRYPVDMEDGHWQWPEFRDRLWAFYARWDTRLRRSSGEVCIEDAAAGVQALQTFRGRMYGLVGFDPRNPERGVAKASRIWAKTPSKEERWTGFIDEMSRGQWLFPSAEQCPWAERLLAFLCMLPQQGRDHADVCAQRQIRDRQRESRMKTVFWSSKAGRRGPGRPDF